MAADQSGHQLLTARVHDGDHLHLFVSAPPTVSIPKMLRVFNCVSTKLLFEEFPEIKERLWGGHFVVGGVCCRNWRCCYCAKIEEYINRA